MFKHNIGLQYAAIVASEYPPWLSMSVQGLQYDFILVRVVITSPNANMTFIGIGIVCTLPRPGQRLLLRGGGN